MQALVLDRPGSADALRLAEVPKPQAGPGELLVAVHAVGLNPVDNKLIASGYRTWNYPFILGLDVAGTIEEVGSGVSSWNVGDAVYYHGDLSRPGGYAEWTVAAAHAVAPLPESISFAEAAALPCAGFTAYQALHRKLHIQPSQTVFVQGGAGGVGGFAVQLAAQIGAKVISSCSPSNADWVRQLGASEVFDYRNDDMVARVKEISGGRGVDALLDTVSSASSTAGLEMLAFGGGIACIAGLPDLSLLRSLRKALSIHEVALGGAYLSGDVIAQTDLALIGREFGALVSSGKIRPMLEEIIQLDEVPRALALWSERRVRGKIVAQLRP